MNLIVLCDSIDLKRATTKTTRPPTNTIINGNLQTPNITNTRYIFSKEKDFSQPQLEVENTQTLLAFALFYIAAVLLFVKGIYDGILIYAGYSRYSDKAVYEIANKAFKEPWS